MPLSQAQTDALSATERAVSVFSIVGILFILVTFYFLKSFHKPINRLIFFASFGNLGMNIACLIAEDGIASGPTSSLCTFQAFLIQMYDIPMAIKVGDEGLTMSLQLWCWIDIKWDFLRIALLYGIVWVAIVFAFGIYVKAGRVIYKRRDQLKGFLNPLNEHPFDTGVVTTCIDIKVEHVTSPSEASANHTNVFDKDFDRNDSANAELDEFHPYAVNIEAPERRPSGVREVTREVARKETTNPGAWLYARVAFLFFISMLVIWLPSSANRVYALAHPNQVNFPLNYVSALVLPAQGFLNAIVYIITSQTAIRQLINALRGRERMPWRSDRFQWVRNPRSILISSRRRRRYTGDEEGTKMETKRGSAQIDLELSELERKIGGFEHGRGKGAGKKVWEKKRSLGSLSMPGSEVSVPMMAHTGR
ncbi:MAG: hypothetical protein Q9170_001626 [Blastenia crenularia]